MADHRQTIRETLVVPYCIDPGCYRLTHSRPAATRHTHARELNIGDMEAVECERGGEGFEVVAVVPSTPEAAMHQDHGRPDGRWRHPHVVELALLRP
jgi:hypothetical protein